MLRVLREADWLDAGRAQAWLRVLAAVTAVMVAVWVGLSRGGLDVLGKPLGVDFTGVWTASRLVLDGHASLVYVPAAHLAAQRALFPETAGNSGYAAFLYPPTYLLICLPWALLPYLVSLAAWLAVPLGLLLASVRRVLPRRILPWPWAGLAMLAYPGVVLNAGFGQNGFLSAACLGGGMVLADRRPFLAGGCLGILVFKPHLLLEAPVVLLAARRWGVIAGALASGGLLTLLSWWVLGAPCWLGFARIAPYARETLEQGRLFDLGMVRSVFAAVRGMGGGIGLAYLAQAPACLGATVVAAWIAWRRPGTQAEFSVMVAATFLATPYVQDYDLVGSVLPMAWVMGRALRTGWLLWEKSMLLAAYVLPLLARPLAVGPGGLVGPVVLAGLLLVVWRRGLREKEGLLF